MGCDATATIVSRISPEKPQEGVAPAAPAQGAESDPVARRGDLDDEGARQGANTARATPSPAFEGGSMPAPTKEFGPSPTKEAGMPSPTKEWMPSPTKEAGMPSPAKER